MFYNIFVMSRTASFHPHPPFWTQLLKMIIEHFLYRWHWWSLEAAWHTEKLHLLESLAVRITYFPMVRFFHNCLPQQGFTTVVCSMLLSLLLTLLEMWCLCFQNWEAKRCNNMQSLCFALLLILPKKEKAICLGFLLIPNLKWSTEMIHIDNSDET